MANKKDDTYTGHRARLKQRFLTQGIEGFEPHNILELLLFYGIPYRDTNGIAHDLIDTFGSIENVFDADIEQLCKVDGVGENSATLIKLVPEISKYYLQLKYKDRKKFESTDEIAEFLKKHYLFEEHEVFSIMCLDSAGKLIEFKKLTDGGADHTGVNIVKAVELVIKKNAVCVIVAHNHPGGHLKPSVADLNTTNRLREAFDMINVRLLDHIILTPNGYFSMANDSAYSGIFR